MREIFMNVIEINLIMILLVLLLYLFRNKIRRKYGAKCLRLLWILLAIRWMVPVNFSFHVLNFDISWGTPIVTEDGGDVLTNDTLFIAGEDHTSVNSGEVVHTGENLQSGANDTIAIENEVLGSFNRFIHNPYYVILFVWILGCSICLMIIIIEYLRFVGSYYLNLQEITDQSLLKDIKRLEQKYLGNTKIRIYRKNDITSPMLVGCIHPKLILPNEITDVEDMELVLKHELCHYKNRDLWFKWLVNATWLMNWFNPCVYLLKKELMAAMELTCDSYALQNANEDVKAKYARLVLSYAGGPNQTHMFDTSFYNGKRNMKRRIDNMMEDAHKNKFTGFLILSILLILSAGLLVSCGENPRQQAEEARKQVEEEFQGMKDAQQQAEENRKRVEESFQQMEDARQQAEDAKTQAEEEFQRLEDAQQQAEDTRRQMEDELQRLEEEARTQMEEASTGLPNGFIEQPQLMYNNTIYFYYATGRDDELPDGYRLVGTIEIVDSENTPDKDFHAAGVDLYAGQEIYGNSNSPDILYLKYDTGFRKFMTVYYASENPDELNQH